MPSRRDRKEVARPVGDVGVRLRRRLAVGAGVDAQQREVADVAGPAPVVDLAAEVAYRARRRVDQPHVGEFEAVDQHVLEAAVELRHLAAVVLVPLALGDHLLLLVLDRLEAREVVGAGRHGALDLAGDVGQAVGEGGADAGPGQLLGGRAGEEAVGDQVAVGGRVLLQDRERAVMVGDHQPPVGDEPRRAAVDLHRRVEQPRSLLRPQRPGGDLQAQLAQPLRIVLQHLLGGPLSFHGECSCAGGPEAEGEYGGGTDSHGAAVYRRPLRRDRRRPRLESPGGRLDGQP